MAQLASRARTETTGNEKSPESRKLQSSFLATSRKWYCDNCFDADWFHNHFHKSNYPYTKARKNKSNSACTPKPNFPNGVSTRWIPSVPSLLRSAGAVPQDSPTSEPWAKEDPALHCAAFPAMSSVGAFSGPAVVPRGTAPAAAFNIPEEGATVPKDLSFLERFRNSLRASQPEIAPAPVSDAKRQVNLLADAVADLKTEDTVQEEDISSKRVDLPAIPQPNDTPDKEPQSKLEEPGMSEATPKADPEPEPAPNADADDPETQPEAETEPESAEPVSLAFPALRLCASNALVDRDQLDALGLPLGFVWSPFGDLSDIPVVSREPERCGTCGSFLAKGNGAGPVLRGASTWTCAFCARSDNAVAGGASPASGGDAPRELTADVVDYAAKTPHIPAAPHRQAVVVVLDERLRIAEAEWARAAVRAVYESAAAHGRMFALLTYGAAACAADLAAPAGPVALDVLGMTRAARLAPADKRRYFRDPPAQCAAVPADAARAADRVLDVVQRCVAADPVDADADPAADPAAEDARPRRLDVALTVALELLAGVADTENSRILTLMTAAPTLDEPAGAAAGAGPPRAGESDAVLGARFEAIGTRAGDMRLALDFLCFGATDEYAADAILGAARRSRGGVVYSGAHGFVSGAELAGAARFLAQRSTNPGVVSIRVSSPLAVSRVIGPAFPTAAPHTYAVPGVDPTAGFTVILQPHEAASKATALPSHVVVQLAAKSSFVTRVITVRVPITKQKEEFLDAVDAEVSAVVLGKACVVSNGGLTQPVVAARAVDASVTALLNADLKCVSVARLLFELRRGFMLERHGNSDSALIQRALFLRLEGTLASLLLSPRLFTNAIADEDTGLMAEVPLDVSSIRDDAVMVLDAGFNIFLLVGKDADKEADEAVSKSATRVARQRSFPCQLWRLKQDEDSAKLIESYLVAEPEKPRLRLPRLRTVKAINEMTFYGYCKMLAPASPAVLLMSESV